MKCHSKLVLWASELYVSVRNLSVKSRVPISQTLTFLSLILICYASSGLENQIAISTIEQISPFPFDLAKEEIDKYPNAELVFAQEEHKNQGAWTYCQPRFQTAIGNYKRIIQYVGRGVSRAALIFFHFL